ncbi:hypothetical protein [Streptomyces sp. NPDC018059]|uniref:hypothetical protein n=1 Tax=Streptomyces sp. NPDC018059 TaxID=3365041 RepID=UPI0037AE04A7
MAVAPGARGPSRARWRGADTGEAADEVAGEGSQGRRRRQAGGRGRAEAGGEPFRVR